jgi:hypothetical protein
MDLGAFTRNQTVSPVVLNNGESILLSTAGVKVKNGRWGTSVTPLDDKTSPIPAASRTRKQQYLRTTKQQRRVLCIKGANKLTNLFIEIQPPCLNLSQRV